jgi:cysteine desulfurase
VAVLEVVDFLVKQHGFEATYVPVDGTGRVSPESIVAAVTPATVLVSIMHSNNEVGTINPIADIAAALQATRRATREENPPLACHRILLHSDTSQSLGKVSVDVQALGVDYLTVIRAPFFLFFS